MSESRSQNSLDILGRCIDRLEATLSPPIEDIRDLAGIVKHFEIAYEQSIKAILSLLIAEDPENQHRSAKQTFRIAFERGWIADERTFLAMIADRNVTSHTYDEPFARDMVDRIAHVYLPVLTKLHRALMAAAHNA